MLKGVHPLLQPDLLTVLAEMGHGDELALVDANFPAASMGRQVIRLGGTDLLTATEAILSVLPLDTFVEEPLVRMQVVGDAEEVPPVQQEALALAQEVEGRPLVLGSLERHAFYERSRHAYAVVTTGERRPYGDLLLVKGVIGA